MLRSAEFVFVQTNDLVQLASDVVAHDGFARNFLTHHDAESRVSEFIFSKTSHKQFALGHRGIFKNRGRAIALTKTVASLEHGKTRL